MDSQADFTGRPRASDRAGRYLWEGRDSYWTFVPKLLPPAPLIDLGALEPVISSASIAVGRLDGLGEFVPNADWFVAMYVRREAVQSSRIEGTQSSLSDLLAFEAGQEPDSTERREDSLEIVNYVRAMNGGLEGIAERGLSIVLLQALHRDLMEGTRGADKRPGAIRTTQNWISRAGRGGPFSPIQDAVFVPPPVAELPALLRNMEEYLSDSRIPALVQAGVAHAQFETIHPFLDGNGRLGRLLITLTLCKRAVLRRPLLYLSAYFAERKQEYYETLMRVRTEGDWEGWLRFYLRGVELVALQACEIARSLVALRERHLRAARESLPTKPNALLLLESLYRQPVVTVKQAAKLIGVKIPTANALVSELAQIGILEEITGRQRDRVFRYTEYIKTLDPSDAPGNRC